MSQPRPIEEIYPYTVTLRAATEPDKIALLHTLDRALAYLLRDECGNIITEDTYKAIHSMLPPPPRPRAANVIEFPNRRASQ